MSTTSSSSKGKVAASGQTPKKACPPSSSKPNGQPKSKSQKRPKVKDISAEATPGGNSINKDTKVDDISAKTGPEEKSTEATSGTPNGLPAPVPLENGSIKSPLSIASSSDSQWQPVSAGRIRKSNRPKKELHNLPALRIGSADAPNAKPEERENPDGEPFETEEFNAHISEKIHAYSTRRGGAAPSGMTRGIPKNVLVER